MTNPKSILVATDFGECSDDALQAAFALAECFGARAHVVHVFAVNQGEGEQDLLPDSIAEVERTALEKLMDAVAEWRDAGLVGELIVRGGDAADMITRTAEQLGADLIVVGTHGRRGVKRFLLGSVAETVVRGAPCSVLVARSPAAIKRAT